MNMRKVIPWAVALLLIVSAGLYLIIRFGHPSVPAAFGTVTGLILGIYTLWRLFGGGGNVARGRFPE